MTDMDKDGIKAARAYAGWHLGYESWADNIVSAYLNPQEAFEHLKRAKAKYDPPSPRSVPAGES